MDWDELKPVAGVLLKQGNLDTNTKERQPCKDEHAGESHAQKEHGPVYTSIVDFQPLEL